MTSPFATVTELTDELRAGRPVVLLDDEDRENEGDIVIAADRITPEAVAFMACHARGLICLAITAEQTARLGLTPMVPVNRSRMHTAFTVSIEAREGITTGISAHDRAHTIRVASSPEAAAADIVSPGHIFPLTARDGGVLVRTGHTEAAVDLARMAGLSPAGVICEIMKDDGTMARRPDLEIFAAAHGLKMGTIADLVAHRRRHDRLTVCTARAPVSLAGAPFTLHVYRNVLDQSEHLAAVCGDLDLPGPVPVRMHRVRLLDDVLQADDYLQRCLRSVAAAGRGVCVLLRDNTFGALTGAVDRLRAPVSGGEPGRMLREYGIGAQILQDLGVREVLLLSDGPLPEIPALEGYGLSLSGCRPPLP